jgi:crotonobetainyl-CoA:carnitine CoA-transferase CaiB-like acyl-CoA transferase
MSETSPASLPEARGALDGIRVLDLTRYIPGPYCTMLLGDLGADVVKLEEPPIGDPTRMVPPPVGEQSVVHAALNRNKRSVLVDLRRDEGAALVRRLAAMADVLVEGFRPGVLERRGLGAGALRELNPRLVYCSLTGYGLDGPLASRAGHDIDYVARAGYLGANRDEAGRPVLPAAQVGDMSGALVATIGILAALQARERSGAGQVVDASMLDSVLALLTVPAARLLAGGERHRELTGSHAAYNVFRCRDGGYVAVGALEPKFWEALCRAVDLPDRVARQWETGEERLETQAAFARAFEQKDRDDWVRVLADTDACVEPVLELAEALEQEQVRERRALSEGRSGDSAFRTVASPLRLSGTPTTVRREAPRAGEHTGELLAEAGYSTDDMKRLRAEGIVA